MQETKAQILLRFFSSLRAEASRTQLFLVGDIFDLWLGGHDYFVRKFKPLLQELEGFVAAGGRVHYFEGNHDLHLRGDWDEKIHAKVYDGPEFFMFNDEVIRVEHGDEMDPEDRGYLFLRWFLRTGFITWVILHLPGDVVARIGQAMSKTSRSYTNSIRDTDRILRVIHTHAQKVHGDHPFSALITGHVHLRDEFHFQKDGSTVRSFNLGSWDESPKILKLEEKQWSWVVPETAGHSR